MSHPIISSDITEAAPARCGRCHKVYDSQQLTFINNNNAAAGGRFCCPGCLNYYTSKPTTVVRGRDTTGLEQYHNQIQFNTNRAQRAEHGAPPTQVLGNNLLAPSVSVPGTSLMPRYPNAPPQVTTPFTSGYTAQHAQFNIQYQRASRQAYAPTEVINIRASFGYTPRNNPKLSSVGNVLEGIENVDVHIGANELKALIFNTLRNPWAKWSKNFPLNASDVTLRVKRTYVAVEPRIPDRDVISSHFFKPQGKLATPKFKTGTLELVLVLDDTLFDAVLDHKIEQENPPTPTPSVRDGIPTSKAITRVASLNNNIRPLDHVKPPEESTASHALGGETPPENPWEYLQDDYVDDRPITPPRSSSKHPISPTPHRLPVTPEPKRAKPTFVSPKTADLERALQNQGPATSGQVSTLLKTQIFPVTVHVLRRCSLEELMADPTLHYTTPKPIFATLEANMSKSINTLKGAFKTAHLGSLVTTSPTLDKKLLQEFPWDANVCIKQPYYIKPKAPNQAPGKVLRMDAGREMKMLLQELRCQAWAQALMNLVYDFMDREVAKRGNPPFETPQMRFVDSALVVQQRDSGHVLLAEEYISNEEEGGFRKYLDNSHATPFEDLNIEDLFRANFLCFAQHVQWQKTNGKAFISDYQGGRTLLTDPQIMTHPALGSDLFSDGNIPGGFEDFGIQHNCNIFCDFFGLEPLAALPEDDPPTEAA